MSRMHPRCPPCVGFRLLTQSRETRTHNPSNGSLYLSRNERPPTIHPRDIVAWAPGGPRRLRTTPPLLPTASPVTGRQGMNLLERSYSEPPVNSLDFRSSRAKMTNTPGESPGFTRSCGIFRFIFRWNADRLTGVPAGARIPADARDSVWAARPNWTFRVGNLLCCR
jgi:hypothetical protein